MNLPICDRCLRHSGPPLRPIQQRIKSGHDYQTKVDFWCVNCCEERKNKWRLAVQPIRAPDIAEYILSLRQPWAWLILNGWKDCENRSWKSQFAGRVLIHASLNLKDYLDDAKKIRELGVCVPSIESIQVGGIVGCATFAIQRGFMASAWFSGPFAWPVNSYFAFSQMTPTRGMQRLYKSKSDQRIVL